MNHFYKLILSIVLLTSCAKKTIDGVEKFRLPRKTANELVFALDSLSKFKPNYFYSKIACKFSDTNQNVSFKTSLRIIKDSAINAVVSFLNIPIARAHITPDTLLVINNRENCVTKSVLSSLKERFGISFGFDNMEELFLGLPFAFDSTQKYHHPFDPFNYKITSHKKRLIRRNNRRNEEDIIFSYFLNDSATGLKQMQIVSPEDTAMVTVDYLAFEMHEGHNYPKEMILTVVTPKNRMVIEMTYNKVNTKDRPEIDATIPEDYEECK